MKKSFLKRVAAAVVAVPVALTQTALFTSFAAGETTDAAVSTAKSYTVEDLIAVKADAALIAKDNFVSKANTRFTADELNATDKYTFVQTSSWNKTASVLLGSRSGNVYDLTAQKEQIANAIKKDGAALGIIKNAIKDEKSTVKAEIDGTDVIVTIDFDYGYSQDLAKLMETAMNKKIAQKYDDVSVTVEQNALTSIKPIKGQIVMTADGSKLATENSAAFNATIKFEDAEKKGIKDVEEYVVGEVEVAIAAMRKDAALAVENEIKAKKKALDEAKAALAKAEEENDAAKIDAAQKEVEAAALALDHAEDTQKENLENYADDLRNQLEKLTKRFEGFNKNPDVEVKDAANVDELLAKVDSRFKKAPASIDAIEKSDYFSTFTSIFDEAIKIANASSNEPIAITVDDVVKTVKSAYNIDAAVKGTTTTYTAQGETLFYVPDTLTAEDKAIIIDKLNNSKDLQAANKEVDPATFTTVKVVEALGAATSGLEFKGSGAMDIYRIISFDVKDKEETTTSTTETTTSTETTATESTSTEEETTTSTTSTSEEETTTSTTSTSEEETTTSTTSTSEEETTTSTTSTSEEETTTSTTSTSEGESTETTTSTETSSTETTNTQTTASQTNVTETTATETTGDTGTTTKNTKVAGQVEMNVTVKTVLEAGAGFYYAHDEMAFDTDKLIEKPTVSPELNGEVNAANFTLGTASGSVGASFSPNALFEANKAENAYVVKDLNVYYKYGEDQLLVVDSNRKPVTVKVYVGVKGDINQDGECNAKDATRTLVHAAQVGNNTGEELPKLTDFEDIKAPAAATDAAVFDNFVVFLGDTNTESSKGEDPKNGIAVNSGDATNMLVYAAKVGNNPKDGEEGHKTVTTLWEELLSAIAEKLPEYSEKITNAAKAAKNA